MKRRIREFMVKLFSLTLAITMCIPTNVYAISMAKKPKQMPTSIRIADSGEENQQSYIDDDQESTDEDPNYEESKEQTQTTTDQNPQSFEENKNNYTISQKAKLNNKEDAIIYEIKVTKKQASTKSDSPLKLSLATYKTQALKDIKITKILIDGKETKIQENKADEDKSLHSKTITTPSIEKEITYTLEGAIDKKAIDNKKLYTFDLSLDLGQTNIDLQRISYKFIESQKEDDPEEKELKLTHVKENEDELRSISYNKEESEDRADEINYTDYLISKDKADEESKAQEKNKIEYKLSLTNIKEENTEIYLDYYKASDKGFALQKEYSTKIPYQEKLDLDVPASYILKLTVRSKVNKKDTKIEKYAINSREVKSPRFVKEEEKSSDDDEAHSKKEEKKKQAEEKAKAEEEKRIAKEKKAEDKKAAEEKAKKAFEAKAKEEKEKKDAEAKKKEEAKKKKEKEEKAKADQNKKEETNKNTSKSTDNNKKEADKETSPAKENKNSPSKEEKSQADKKQDKTSSNEIKKEAPSATKQEKEKKKEELSKLIKEEKGKAQNKEEKKGLLEGVKSLLGLTNLQKADKELKKALADEKNGLVEIQKLLTELGEKYKLERSDQAKLMADNEDALKALIEKYADKDFAPQMLFQTRGANTLNLEGKKFIIQTIFLASTKEGPIGTHQYFDLILDNKLKVNDPDSLPNIEYNGRVIARPKYIEDENKIRYQIAEEIKEDLELPINVPVDYNIANISLDEDETFTVINKVKGLGVNKPPRDLLPQKVDKNGNPAGSIIEPGRHDVTQIIEPANENYKVNMDATALPDIQNGELQGYNWKVMVSSDKDLKDLNFKMNFTTVKGSGLGQIETPSYKLSDNPIKGNLGINDSKHYDHEANTRDLTLTFYTPIVNKQEKYMLDISTIVKDKLGAKRVLAVEGYAKEKVIEETPTRVGLNNRTTIRGEFANETSSKWTVTDAISTGDEKDDKGKKKDTKLPLETRILKNQSLASSKMAVYQVDTNKTSSTFGKMIEVSKNDSIGAIPDQFTNPNTDQPVGTIAAYEYTARLDMTKQKYSLGGVDISKAIDLAVRQDWSMEKGAKIPEHTIKVVNAEGEHEEVLGEITQPASDDGTVTSRFFVIPNVKTWKIADDGSFTKYRSRVIQVLPDKVKQTVVNNNLKEEKTFRFFENYSWYLKTEHMHYLQNKGVEYVETKYGSFTLVKTDVNEKNKKLPEARFQLLGGPEVETDENGEATFNNIAPGSYQLIETRAPDSYKLNDSNTTISVDIEGRVSAEGKYATIKGGASPTATIKHPDYPGYMNTMHFGTVDAEGNFKTYIYLRALGSINGGSTDRDTRLNMSVDGEITNVKVFDVEPSNRNIVQRRMNVQNIGQHSLYQALNVDNEHPIKGTWYNGKKAYTIGFPKERFNGDWGFLVEVTGVSKDRKLKYDWLTDRDNNQAKLEGNTVNFTDTSLGSKTVVTVTNEKFKTKPVEIKKVDQNKNPLAGATFTIKAQNSTKILMTKQSDSKGEVNFGDLPEGKYVIEELQSPDNYQESQVVFDVTVDSKQQVSYKPRFKEGDGSPTNGVDYWIDNKTVEDTDNKAPVIHVSQNLELMENGYGSFGQHPGVWEAYRYESYRFNANIKVSDSSKGKRFAIQFDRNLDLTQYVNKIPTIKNNKGVDIADPYFDYDTNLLTYVFNGNSGNGETDFNLVIDGIIPSKYSAKRNGIYNYVIQVAPGNSGQFDSTSEPIKSYRVIAEYDDYDARDGNSPAQAYYFRDVYLKDGQWYFTAIAYYNPKKSPNKDPRTLYFNWATTNYRSDTTITRWPIAGDYPAFGLEDIKIYRCLPKADPDTPQITSNVANMPISMGVRPERDPYTYERVFSSSLDYNNYFSDRQNGIGVDYDPTQIKNSGKMNEWTPLKISMPRISSMNEGYVIEQTFKVTNLEKFRDKFRAFYMANNRGFSNPTRPSYQESAFASKVNSNSAVAQQAKKEIPKYFSQDVMMVNKSYTPAKFNIIKLDASNPNKKLAGAEFVLIDKLNRQIYRRTDANGVLTFDNLKPGKYRLEEVNAPTDYVKSNKKWQVNVVTDGTVTITETGINVEGTSIVGQNIFLKISNKPKGKEFKIYKKDEDGGPLKGAKFLVSSYANGKETPFTTGTSNENGLVDFDKKLPKGIYTVIELEAPSGYKKSDEKWALVVNDDGVKIYKYLKGPENNTNVNVNKSILSDEDNWVNVGGRDSSTWTLGDHRWTGYADKNSNPYKVGTRIIAINKKDKYVIQRYVVNPEGKHVGASKVQIHREKPDDPNMDWYAGGAVQGRDYQIYQLDKPVTTAVEDIKLENYKLTKIEATAKLAQKPGEASKRLEIDLPKTDKPIVIDVKIPYKNENSGVGTGIDYFENFNEPGTTNKASYWKPDFYTKVTRIVEGDKVKVGYEGGNILGPYLTEGTLSLKNDRQRYDFKFKKVREKQAGETQADAVSGATFKLTGPKPSDETKWAHSDAKGMVKFDKLLPGIYKLKEHSPAQGYEPADTDWTVTIKEDGRIFFKDNHPDKKIVKPEEQWQTVEASSKKNYKYYTSNGSPNKLETKITEVNKATNKFRQVYILNKAPDNLVNPYFEIHAQEEKRGLNLTNTKILSVRLVGRQSTPDSLQYIGEDIDYDTKVYVKNNNQERIQIKPKNLAGNNKTIAVTIESDLPLQGTIGTGMDFYSYNDANHYWVGEWYNTLSDMNLKPVKGPATSRSSSYEVPNASDRSANGKYSKTLMARMVRFTKKDLPMPGKDSFDISKLIKNLVVEAPRKLMKSANRMAGTSRAAGDWEAVDPDKSSGRADIKHNESLVQTKITEINKGQKRFKQIFLYKEESDSKDRLIEIHRQPENAELRLGYAADIETYVNVYKVNASTIDQALKASKTKITVSVKQKEATGGKPRRIQVEVPAAHRGYILVEVEAKYTNAVGLGSDYYPNRNQQYDKTVQWVGDSYSSESSINDKTQITYEYGSEEEVIPITYATQSDPNMDEGQTRVERGQEGKKRVYYKYEVSNGVRTGRKFIDTGHENNGVEIITPMKPEITYRGTRKPQPQEQPYDVTVYGYIYNGKVTPNKTKAKAGEEVTLTIEPKSGYELKTLYYNDEITGDDIPITNNKFTMPKSNVRINATFGLKNQPQPTPTKHKIFIKKGDGGNVVIEGGKTEAAKDEKVTFTLTPNSGFAVNTISVAGLNGVLTLTDEGNGRKSFVMPNEDVSINATFKQTTPSYNVNISNDIKNGTVSVDKPNPQAGELVKVTVKANPTFEIEQIKLNNTPIEVDDKGEYVFTMPKYDVNITASFTQRTGKDYDIYNGADSHTRLTLTHTKAKEGQKIKANISPDNDWQILNVRVAKADGTGDVKVDFNQSEAYFTMPASDVTVYTASKPIGRDEKTISITKAENGRVFISKLAARPNEPVYLTAKADGGYELKEFIVTDENDNKVMLSANMFRMPSSKVNVTAVFQKKDDTPDDPNDPGDEITNKTLEISNKQSGLELNIYKKDTLGRPLEGGEFLLRKVDSNYQNPDSNFFLTAVSNKDGKVTFRDQTGKIVKLKVGYYTIEETKPPVGYKKASSKWNVEVKTEQGRMFATYYGPEQTTVDYLVSDKTKLQNNINSNEDILYASKIKDIDPNAKTFVQRIMIDLRGYKGTEPINVQIKPKHKREEFDIAGQHPHILKEGVKTAYRTTYRINDPDPNIKADDILNSYDLSRKNVTMINTARWRPFDWGFDEDQINLTPGGLYFMDVEGFYDDAIVDGTAQKEVTITHEKEGDKMVDKAHPVAPHVAEEITADDLAKIQLDFELYQGARCFEQAVYNENTRGFDWKSFKKASYQAGAQAIAKTKEEGWAGKYGLNNKYQNWLGLDGGRIKPSLLDATPYKTIKTEANISSLYTTRKKQAEEIPKEGLDLTNEEESYNITFSKHGRDDPKLGINDLAVTNNRLEGAIFKLQRKIGNDYDDIPGSYVSSAFNGFFGFRGLKPGRYRLMEVQAPAGYKPINDAVLEMTIAYEKGKISEETGDITPGRGVITLEYDNAHSIVQYAGANSENTGKLVDYVTSATAKNMGKIINEKPEKGKLEITKTDEEGKSLSGAKFKLSRISKPAVNNGVDYSEVDKKRIYEGTVGNDGKLAFNELPIGQYELEETSPAPGHKLTGQIWNFTVGGKNLDPYYDNNDRSGIDQSKNITLASTMTVERPEPGDTTKGDTTIHPNMNQSMNFENTFTIKDGATISPGDYFTVNVAENMDMMGIYKKDFIRSLDIFADGIGTIAKADYDDANNTITYTFTDYARTYQLNQFVSNIKAYIRTNKIRNSANGVEVGLAMNDASFKNINVSYDLDEKDATDKAGNNLNISSKITQFDPRTGQFTHYIYINRNSKASNGAEFIYKPGKKVKNLRMQVFKVDPANNKDAVMPSSYNVLDNNGMTEVANTFYNRLVEDDNPAWTKFGDEKDGYLPLNENPYIIKLSGEIADKDKTTYSPEARLRRYNASGYVYMWVKTENEVYSQINIGEGKKDLQITAINPKNTIVFRKIDQQARPLQGAEFGLEKQNGKAWEEVKGPNNEAITQKSGPDGLLRFENLPEGKYALVETKAPPGYSRIETHILEFDVSKSGIITRQVKRKASKTSKEQLVTETVGTNPIEVINYKDIDFVKIDADDKTKLEGATFKLCYKENESDKYRELTEDEYNKEIKSDKDGKFKVHVTKEGYYALKETKAPNKYIKPKKFVREFRLKNGKIQILEKDPLKASLTIGKNDQMESRILSVDQNKKQFTQRIVLNYLHNEVPFDGNETYLRFFGNGWEITPKLKVGGKIKVAVLDEGKKIDDLKATDYKECDAHDRQSETNVVSKYLIKDLLGEGNYTVVDKAKGTIKSKKSIVIEYTGQILDKASQKGDGVNAEVKQDLYNDLTILDQLSYKLNLDKIKSGKRVYVDKSDLRATEVINHKSVYPDTGGLGVWIGFAILGSLLMTLAGVYLAKKNKEKSKEELG